MPLTDLQAIYPRLVTSGETIFTGEVNQWGQFVQNTDKSAEEETTDTRTTNALMSNLQLSDEQIDTIRKIVAAGTPKAAFSQQTITVHPEETSALPARANVPTPAEVQAGAQSVPLAGATAANVPVTLTTTRTDTTTIQPQESTSLFPEDGATVATQAASPDVASPISVTTTRVDTTVVDHVIPAADVVAEYEPPQQEAMDALSPGAMHVDAPQDPPEDTDALMSHHEFANEPPPPEAMSSLSPGAMHVDAPQAPPDNPNPEADPNANG